MLEAVVFHREIRTGSSLPLVVSADDGRRYVLKAHGSGDGVVSNVIDWLALGLGRRLGIPVLEPRLLRIVPGFESQAGDPEIRDLLGKSLGANFASPFVEDAHPPDDADFARLSPQMRHDLFLYDLFLLNVDRHGENPNAVVSASGFHCLDFSAAMALRGLLSGTRLSESAFLKQIRRNSLYAPGIDPGPFIERLRSVPPVEVQEIVGSLPDEWLSAVAAGAALEALRESLVDRLLGLLLDAAVLVPRLEALRAIPFETDEERLRRSQANKADFERRFGKFGSGQALGR